MRGGARRLLRELSLRRALRCAGVVCLTWLFALAFAEAVPARPVAVFSYYQSERLPNLIDALNRSGMPSTTPVYFGNYIVQPRSSASAAEVAPPNEVAGERYRWAPLLQISESTLWDRRRVSAAEAETLAASGQHSHAGSMPSFSQLLALPSAERVAWGTELGRRFRDRIRERLRSGAIKTWQFDEIPTEAAGQRGRAYRDFVRGVLQGLHEGRAPLGDRPRRGFVWVARPALSLAGRSLTRELARFWRTVNAASLRFVGEEYPYFRGSASDAAYRQAGGQRALRRGGGDRRALASRYLVGMTPGYKVTRTLGGNIDGRSRQWVNAWRAEYVRVRARMGTAGFGEFNFAGANATDVVMRDVARAVARGVAILGG